MKEIQYEFDELDRDTSFRMFGKSFGGVLENQTLFFDNEFGNGRVIKLNPQPGLWIRIWHFTTQQKISLYKLPTSVAEKKFCLLYLFDPAIVCVKNNKRRILLNSRRNNLLFSNDVSLSFCPFPKQPFSLADLTFPLSWLQQELEDVTDPIRDQLDRFAGDESIFMVQCCSLEEYKTLHELKVGLLTREHNPIFIRSRIYSLIGNFLNKIRHEIKVKEPCCNLSADQALEIEELFMENLHNPPSISTIARKLSMSAPSLLRQFKLMYGRGIHEHFIGKKMELAKRMILQQNLTIKKTSEILGYKQPSPFIKIFTQFHGFSPGTLNR